MTGAPSGGSTLSGEVVPANPQRRGAGDPLRLDLEGDAAIRRPVPVATEPPPQIGTDVLQQEPDDAELAPLADVYRFVTEQTQRGSGPGPHGDDPAEGDGVRARRDGASNPEQPPVWVAFDPQNRRDVSARRYFPVRGSSGPSTSRRSR